MNPSWQASSADWLRLGNTFLTPEGEDLPDDPPFAGLDKSQQIGQAGIEGNFFPDGVTGLLDIEVAATEEAVGFAEGADFFRGETATLETDLIDPPDFRRIPVRNHEGRHILNDFCATSQDGMLTDATELVDTA
jgi:hypothetical protein